MSSLADVSTHAHRTTLCESQWGLFLHVLESTELLARFNCGAVVHVQTAVYGSMPYRRHQKEVRRSRAPAVMYGGVFDIGPALLITFSVLRATVVPPAGASSEADHP